MRVLLERGVDPNTRDKVSGMYVDHTSIRVVASNIFKRGGIGSADRYCACTNVRGGVSVYARRLKPLGSAALPVAM